MVAVRDLATATERRWTIDKGLGVGTLVWAPDNRELYFQLRGETSFGHVNVLDTTTAPIGSLAAAAKSVSAQLNAGEWLHAPQPANEGVFLQIYCCKTAGQEPSIIDPRDFGLVTPGGFRRIESPVRATDEVIAVDSNAQTIIAFDLINSALIRVSIDGTTRALIGSARESVFFY